MDNIISDEHCLAIINKKKWKITFFWNKLTQQQQQKLFELSVSERNFEIMDFLYKKTPWLVENIKPILIKAGTDGDIELVTFLLERIKVYRLMRERIKGTMSDIVFSWSNSYNCLKTMEKLDHKNLTELSSQLYFIEKIIRKKYYISPDNQIVDHPEYQLVIDTINKNGINLINYIQEIVQEIIRPDGYYLPDNETNEKELLLIKNIIENYIEDEKFLATMLEQNSKKYPYKNIIELKQNILNNLLKNALNHKELKIAQYFLEQGASINIANPENIKWMLSQNNVELIQSIILANINIDEYKKEAISVHTIKNNIEAIKCLIDCFEDKNQAAEYIENARTSAWDSLSESLKSRINTTKNEMKAYIESILFEEKLQKSLPTQSVQTKYKI